MLLALALLSDASAVPMQLTHSGRMMDGGGLPIAGGHNLRVLLYTAPTGGLAVWEEEMPVAFDEGYFTAVLGADTLGNPLDDTILDGATLYVSVSVDGGAETDRLSVVSVPYAVRAGTASSVQGGVVDASEIQIDGTTVIDASGTFVGSGGDTLAGLSCSAGSVALFDGTVWSCADYVGDWSQITNVPADLLDGDDVLDEAAVDAFVANNGYADSASLAPIATSGDWTDLANVPADLLDGDDVLDEAAVDAYVANNGYADAASLANIATSGDWTDLGNVPADFADGIDNQLDEAAVDLFVANNGYALSGSLAGIATTGDWGDLLNVPGDIADGDDVLDEAAVDAYVANNGYVTSGSLAAIATSGDWSDLANVPGGFADGVDNDTIYTDADASAAPHTGDQLVGWINDAATTATVDVGRLDPIAGAGGGNMIPNPHFEAGLDHWSFSSGTGSVQTVTDSIAGLNVFQNAGGVTPWIYSDALVPINRDRAYQVRGSFRRTDSSGTAGTIYLAVRLWDDQLNNITGDGTWWFYPVSGVTLPQDNTWYSYTADFGAGTAEGLPANARYATVGAILNYNGGDTTYQVTDLGIYDGGGMQPQEVFRATSGGFGFSGPTGSWRDHTPNAAGTLRVTGEPFSWMVTLGGHWSDGSGKRMQFRVRATHTQTGAVSYLPDATGVRKYVYINNSRLEEITFNGVDALASGTYDVQLEVNMTENASAYNWNATYGHITMTAW